MSNAVPFYIPLIAAMIGGFLSIFGGSLAVILRVRIDKKQEIEYIKVSLMDELQEIYSIIGNLCETYRTAHSIPNTYLNELKANTESYDNHRKRLFIIPNELLRKEITGFYKRLSTTIENSLNTVGTLGEQQQGNDHNQIAAEFKTLQANTQLVKDNIKKYRYKILWVI